MKRVFKYPIEVDDVFLIPMPRGAEVLTVQVQCNEPQLWALVDPAEPIDLRTFVLFGTGHDVVNAGAYVGTFQQADGRLVWHLFEAALGPHWVQAPLAQALPEPDPYG